jgi:hypothetical protein
VRQGLVSLVAVVVYLAALVTAASVCTSMALAGATRQGSDAGAEHAIRVAFKQAKGATCLRSGPTRFRCAFVVGPDEEGEVGIARLAVSFLPAISRHGHGHYLFGAITWEWKPCAEVPGCPEP